LSSHLLARNVDVLFRVVLCKYSRSKEGTGGASRPGGRGDRRAITEGEAAQGERLPPAVDLATVLGVNKNTVIRALHILREEDCLISREVAGASVGTPQRGAVLTRIEEYSTLLGPRDTDGRGRRTDPSHS